MLKDILTETPTEFSPDAALKNVVPFRPAGETKSPSLSPVENTAFNELARQLSARLETENGNEAAPAAPIDAVFEPSAARPRANPPARRPNGWRRPNRPHAAKASRPGAARSASRGHPDLPARPAALCQRRFFVQMGYPEPACAGRRRRPRRALCRTRRSNAFLNVGRRQAGEDFREPARRQDAPSAAADARLYTISWDGNSALALIFSGTRQEAEVIAAALADQRR